MFAGLRICDDFILDNFVLTNFAQIIHPLLKFVRGEQLSPDHWLDMFRLLKLPRGTTLEKLTFGDIIKVADEIIANADAIKVS